MRAWMVAFVNPVTQALISLARALQRSMISLTLAVVCILCVSDREAMIPSSPPLRSAEGSLTCASVESSRIGGRGRGRGGVGGVLRSRKSLINTVSVATSSLDRCAVAAVPRLADPHAPLPKTKTYRSTPTPSSAPSLSSINLNLFF